jgi:hypothetical protein
MLLLLLGGPSLSLAGNIYADQARERAFAELRLVSRQMDTLPPCEGHRRFAEATGRYDPPNSCPLAKKFFRSIDLGQNKLVRSCEAYVRHLEPTLRGEGFCIDPGRYKAARAIIEGFKQEGGSAFVASELIDPSDSANNYLDENGGKLSGEYLRPECEMAVDVAMEIRMRQSNFASHHVSLADQAIAEDCSPPGQIAPTDELLRVLREGELGP